MTGSATVILTILLLVAALPAIGIWASRRTHNAADFAIANRRLGPWLVSFGYAANALNAWMLMGTAAAAFAWGISAVWIWGAFVFGCTLNLWFVAPRLRAIGVGTGEITVIQVLSADAGDRLQPVVVRSAVFIVLAMLFLQIAMMLRFAGSLLDDFGFAPTSVTLLSLALVGVSVFVGGMRAVSLTDAVQSIAFLCIAVFLPLPALVATGGWEELKAAVTSLGPGAMDWFGDKRGVAAVAFAAGAFGLGLATLGQPHAANRLMAAKDEASLRIARWIAPLWVAVLLAAVLLCGWCASVLYAGLERPLESLPVIASRLLPPGLAAMIVLALAASVIAGVSGQLLVVATSFAVDLKRPMAALSLGWLRVGLVIGVALAAVTAFYASDAITRDPMFAFTALGASIGPLLFVRLSGKRIRPGATLAAMWAGFVLCVLFHMLPDSPGDFLERVLPFIASLGIALTGGERRRNPDRADRSQETVHDRVPI
jgi:sodium/proline symporter